MKNKQDKTVEVFENAPVPKAVFINIIPSIISMLMVLVYNLADTFFIGQTKNAYMVAAVSLYRYGMDFARKLIISGPILVYYLL